MTSGDNDQAKVLQFAAFRDHDWGHVALYPRWPNVLIAKLFQPPHNDVFPTVKEHVVILDTVQHVPNHGRERLQIVKPLLDR